MKHGQTPPHLGEQIGTTAGQSDVQRTLGRCVCVCVSSCLGMCVCTQQRDRLAALSPLWRKEKEEREREKNG